MRDRAVVVCISGRAGVSPPSGMINLRDKLRESLVPLGVKQENIFRRSWNHNEDDNPFGAPWVSDLNREINQRTDDPTYLALIGFSYGAWAACRLSNATNRVPDFVALIDAVFGPTNTEPDQVIGGYVKNWFQRRGIIRGDCFGLGKIPCVTASNGISCGHASIPGAHDNQEEDFVRNWHGEIKTAQCVFGEVEVEESHVSLDDNEWIWHQIHDQIVSDIEAMPIGWTPILEPRASISIRSKDEFCTLDQFGGAVYECNGTQKQISGRLQQVSIGSDASIFGVDVSANVLRLQRPSDASLFVQIPAASLTNISARTNEDAWGVNALGGVYRWDGREWRKMPGLLRQLSAGHDGAVWGVDAQDDVFRWNSLDAFEQVPGKLKQVAVAAADNVWGVNRANEIYWWNGDHFVLIEEGKLSQIEIGYDGSVWGINKNGLVFRRDANVHASTVKSLMGAS